MANLLPEQYQRTLMREQRARFIIAGAAVATILAFVTMLSLVPSYMSILAATPQAQPPQQAPKSDASVSTQITQTQAVTQQLYPLVSSTSTPMQIILEALSHKPAGISVQHITYSAGSKSDPATITITGAAQEPSIIDAYRALLSKDATFSKVSVPLGALIGENAGNFTLTLSGAF